MFVTVAKINVGLRINKKKKKISYTYTAKPVEKK